MDAVYQADRVWLLDIQRKLYRWSRAEPADAYRDMWNWVTDPRNLRLAWRRVASNRGARSAGPDKRTVRDIQRREGPQRFLDRLRRQLRNGSYRPTPVRRVMIPKRGKPGKLRPLGVPTVKDRVVQAALLQLLERTFCPSRTASARGRRVATLWSTSGTRSARSGRRPRPIGRVRPINGSSKGTFRADSTTSTTITL